MRTCLVIALLTFTSLTPLAQSPVNDARITGVVIDGVTDQPLSSVLVQIAEIRMLTDGRGRFTVEHIPSGKRTLIATKDGYLIGRLGKYRAANAGIDIVLRVDEVVDLTIFLFPAATVTGEILNSSGKPVSNIEILPLPYRYNDEGKLVLAGSKTPGSGLNLITKLLVPAGIDSIPNENRANNARTDDRGQFRIFNLDPGKYTFAIRALAAIGTIYYPGVLNPADAESIELESGNETHLKSVTLRPGDDATIVIKIDDQSVAPTQLRGVLLRYKGGMDLLQMPLSGSRSLSGVSLPPGTYEAEAVTGNSGPPISLSASRIEFDLRGTDREIKIPAPRGVVLRGIAIAESLNRLKRQGDVHISFGSNDVLPTYSISLTSDMYGAFFAASFPEGDFRIRSIQGVPDGLCVREIRQGDRNVLRDGLQVSGPETNFQLTLTESMSTVQGHVTETDGSSIQGAIVVLVPDDHSQTHMFVTAVTDWKGFYEMPCVRAGFYHLYSWMDLNGAEYRNAEFLKRFEARGQQVRIEDGTTLKMDALVPVDLVDIAPR
jgi:hypothetical protein